MGWHVVGGFEFRADLNFPLRENKRRLSRSCCCCCYTALHTTQHSREKAIGMSTLKLSPAPNKPPISLLCWRTQEGNWSTSHKSRGRNRNGGRYVRSGRVRVTRQKILMYYWLPIFYFACPLRVCSVCMCMYINGNPTVLMLRILILIPIPWLSFSPQE
jgi:hypothetical protein